MSDQVTQANAETPTIATKMNYKVSLRANFAKLFNHLFLISSTYSVKFCIYCVSKFIIFA